MGETPVKTAAAKVIAELQEKKLLNDKQLEGLAKSLPGGAIKRLLGVEVNQTKIAANV